ncbi:MAG: YCF48-related protein, partial [Desulfobacterota bacterium]|nr:YCF48-related protein [Thermodesulfobacteriota bacterium]
VNGQQGWAVGNKGLYLRSTDGGKTWAEQSEAIKTKFWLRSIAFCDAQTGFIVGARGTVAKTEDGGATWNIISGFRYDTEEFGLADF